MNDPLAIPQLDVDRAFGVTFLGRANVNVFCPFHEDPHTSRTQSCSVSSSGVFHCKVCRHSGTAAEFYAKTQNCSVEQARQALSTISAQTVANIRKHRRAAPLSTRVTERLVQKCCANLASHSYFRAYLRKERGFSEETIATYKLGCDEHRITYPVYRDGILLNIRRYLPHATGAPKMVTHELGNGTPVLYPDGILQRALPGSDLILCEGEADALLLNQHGFPAITHTGGVSTWNPEWTDLLARARVRVTVLYDVNDKEAPGVAADLGQRMAQQRFEELVAAGVTCRVVRLPIPDVGGDVTDWFVKHRRTARDLHALLDEASAPYTLGNTSPSELALEQRSETLATPEQQSEWSRRAAHVDRSKVLDVTLAEASSSSTYHRALRFRGLVAGRAASPYFAPKRVSIEVESDDGTVSRSQHVFDAWNGNLLSFIDCSAAAQKRAILAAAGIPPTGGEARVRIEEVWTIEEVHLIAPIEEARGAAYGMRRCFCVGHSLETNRIYTCEGFALPDPATQEATHLIVTSTPALSNLDSYTLAPAMQRQLRRLFAVGPKQTAFTKLEHIANALSRGVTRIVGRKDLHTIVDLTLHSVGSFNFDGVLVRKGWLELLVIGDTRTGKGYVTEGLLRYYGVGEVLSGENLTLAGLVGAVQRVGDRWTLTWGRLPLNDRGAVVLDEASAMSPAMVGALSRIRSEGVAEVTKVISERTTARTRLIWIANPRASVADGQPRMLSSYTYGVEAALELMGSAEDAARLDCVITVAQSEVDATAINARQPEAVSNPYTADACRALVLWAWSRTPDQIRFEDDAVETVLQAAKALGRQFSPRLCLIQAEDVRFKLARLACAAAARLFSTPDGVQLVVTREHVEYAYNLLVHLYSKPSSGYSQLSAADRERSSLRDETAVVQLIEQTADAAPDLVEGLLATRVVTQTDIMDFAGVDQFNVRTIVSGLVRARALRKQSNGYVKEPAFVVLLQRLKQRYSTDHHVTQEDTSDDSDSTSSSA